MHYIYLVLRYDIGTHDIYGAYADSNEANAQAAALNESQPALEWWVEEVPYTA